MEELNQKLQNTMLDSPQEAYSWVKNNGQMFAEGLGLDEGQFFEMLDALKTYVDMGRINNA